MDVSSSCFLFWVPDEWMTPPLYPMQAVPGAVGGAGKIGDEIPPRCALGAGLWGSRGQVVLHCCFLATNLVDSPAEGG